MNIFKYYTTLLLSITFIQECSSTAQVAPFIPDYSDRTFPAGRDYDGLDRLRTTAQWVRSDTSRHVGISSVRDSALSDGSDAGSDAVGDDEVGDGSDEGSSADEGSQRGDDKAAGKIKPVPQSELQGSTARSLGRSGAYVGAEGGLDGLGPLSLAATALAVARGPRDGETVRINGQNIGKAEFDKWLVVAKAVDGFASELKTIFDKTFLKLHTKFSNSLLGEYVAFQKDVLIYNANMQKKIKTIKKQLAGLSIPKDKNGKPIIDLVGAVHKSIAELDKGMGIYVALLDKSRAEHAKFMAQSDQILSKAMGAIAEIISANGQILAIDRDSGLGGYIRSLAR